MTKIKLMTKTNRTALAAAMFLAVGAGATQAEFLEPGSTGTITVTGACFTFGVCAVDGSGNDDVTDNAITVAGIGSGIAGDGVRGIMTFTVSGDGNSFTLDSFNMDTYTNTAGGSFATRMVDTSGAGGTINDDGSMTLNLAGRTGIAEFFVITLGEQPWNLDTHGAVPATAACAPGSGAYTEFTTGTSSNRNCSTGATVATLTGTPLAGGGGTWTGTLVSAGNVGSAWGGFDGTPYTEIYNITVTGTVPTDTTPDSFTLNDLVGQLTSTLIESNSITVTGINAAAPVAVSGEAGSEYEINGSGTWTGAPGTVNLNDQVRVRHTSSADPGTTTQTTLTIGGVSETFSVQTAGAAPDTEPEPFTFIDQPGVPLSSVITSAAVTIEGINTSSPISISAGGEYEINGSGTWTSAGGTVGLNDEVRVRHTSSASPATPTSTELTIGGISATFTSTTVGPVTTPEVFAFVDQDDVPTSSLITSAPITVAGINTASPISISGAADSEYEINGSGIWTSAAGTVNLNDQVRVRHTSAGVGATPTDTTLTIGGRADTFTSTTVGGAGASRGNNFTMLATDGSPVDGTNDVTFTRTGPLNTSTATAVTNATLSSPTPFYGSRWIAHHVMLYEGGQTYVIYTDCAAGDPDCGSGLSYTVTVAADEIMAHMLFDWAGNPNIDVINVYKVSQVFGPSPMHTAQTGNNPADKVWDYMSSDTAGVVCSPGAVDSKGDPAICTQNSINGVPMIDGPFKGYNANFNLMLTGTQSETIFQPLPMEVSESTKMPGCTISARPVGPLERGDWWLVGGFIAWLAWVRRRAQRQSLH